MKRSDALEPGAVSDTPGHRQVSRFGVTEGYRASWLTAAAVTLALFALRAPQTFIHPQFWAEDGAVFFSEQVASGNGAVLSPYAGYLHLVPRLTAVLASPFGAVRAPAIYAACSVAVTLWSAATIAASRLPFAWVLGSMLMLPPHAGEIFGTITNVQWLMAPALAMIVATPPPARRAARINQLAFAIASSLSGPFAIFLAPVAAWRLWGAQEGSWEGRDRFSTAIAIVVLAAAAVQAACIVADPIPPGGASHPAYVAAGILDRWIGQLALGRRSGTPRDLGLDGILLAAAGCVLLYERRTFLGLFAFAGLMIGSTWFRFMEAPRGTFDGIVGADRYFYGPRLILLWAIVSVLLRRRRPAILAAAVLTMMALHDHQWRRPPLDIMPWRDQAKAIDRGEATTIVINPPVSGDEAPWTVSVPERASTEAPH